VYLVYTRFCLGGGYHDLTLSWFSSVCAIKFQHIFFCDELRTGYLFQIINLNFLPIPLHYSQVISVVSTASLNNVRIKIRAYELSEKDPRSRMDSI
jgi:hypothetical protein